MSCEYIESAIEVTTYCVMSTPLIRKKDVGTPMMEMAVLCFIQQIFKATILELQEMRRELFVGVPTVGRNPVPNI